MKSLDEQLHDLTVYLNKLRRVIIEQASFTFGKTKIVNKARVDDVVCCIQASYPQDFQEYVKRNGVKSLQTYLCFQQLLSVATNKAILMPGSYAVDYPYFEKLLSTFIKTAQGEMHKIIEDSKFKL